MGTLLIILCVDILHNYINGRMYEYSTDFYALGRGDWNESYPIESAGYDFNFSCERDGSRIVFFHLFRRHSGFADTRFNIGGIRRVGIRSE